MSQENHEELNQEEPKFYYSLVLAEVIFQTEKGVSSHRIQLFSKSNIEGFPANRLSQLQNSAAHQIQEQVQGAVSYKQFKALEVLLLNILPLGYMTDSQFWETTSIPDPAPTGGDGDKVVPLTRP